MSIDISVCWCASKNFAKLLCMPKKRGKGNAFLSDCHNRYSMLFIKNYYLCARK